MTRPENLVGLVLFLRHKKWHEKFDCFWNILFIVIFTFVMPHILSILKLYPYRILLWLGQLMISTVCQLTVNVCTCTCLKYNKIVYLWVCVCVCNAWLQVLNSCFRACFKAGQQMTEAELLLQLLQLCEEWLVLQVEL